MLNYLIQNPIAAIIFIVIVVAITIFLLVKEMQRIGTERIRGYVYQLFVEAENKFNYGDNKQKFEYVVQLARSAIPAPFNLFITESLLNKVIQTWFDLCKDLLDDGKLTTKEE